MTVNGLEFLGAGLLVFIAMLLLFLLFYAINDDDFEKALLMCCSISIVVITFLVCTYIDDKRQIDNYKEQLSVYEEEP